MALAASGPGQRLLAFIQLVKPELTGLTVMTGMVAFLFAGGRPFDLQGVLYVGSFMLLVGGSAAAWNQVLERGHDERMKRTERRPLPSGKIRRLEAMIFGSTAGVLGVAGLGWKFGILPASLALATLAIYLAVYTPLKRRTSWNTLVGAIPGALPTLIGWSAAEQAISLPGWIFFLILVLWQFPHFFSLAWMYRADYARAGYRMLPLEDDIQGTRTNLVNLLSIIGLIVATSSLTLTHSTGTIFLALGLTAGLCFLGVAWTVRLQQRTADTASSGRIPRKLFFASLIYLPVVLLGALLDRI
ncbi:MAG: heme o synthase [Bacteroidetes bacterium]|jgi:protoheme IX farnesyltransferase|nr:heme o synthase [Bacteroidota bacterium]